MNAPVGSDVAPISRLELDRRFLTLIVVGAGFGESVLVALPRSDGWLVIDGAAPNSAPPAVELLERYWSDASAIELLLLTHPHADHYAGFLKILDHEKLGPTIKRIGCVSHYLGIARGNVLGREIEVALEAVDIDDPDARRELGRARNVLERIGDEWLKQPSRRWAAVRGATLAFNDDLRLHIVAPERTHVDSFFTGERLAQRVLSQANDLSIVVDLHFGATRLVLGGDLPNERNAQLVSSGWSYVCSTIAGLNEHTSYKVSHHASREAIHTGVVGACGVVRGHGSPRPGTEGRRCLASRMARECISSMPTRASCSSRRFLWAFATRSPCRSAYRARRCGPRSCPREDHGVASVPRWRAARP